ncbi:hypothetical protein K9O30_15465 [Clostridium bowmanii]|uniref:DUF6115 domain-containing protein n=1 Tax=Clostridium bowmanii TaxID=132925 RepID=UPI001C0D5D2C|nr:hypothetical protein [Clostridium bowmanii]MBU3190565.1 hypothetical protein [Clostridium bowmanii]MCA1075096.1 hypothetical protein [Clostridium bowmanii]
MTGLLIFVGLILIILNVLSIKKQSKSFKGVLGDALEDTTEYDIKIGELKREFSESILELQSELVEIKEIINKNNSLNKVNDALKGGEIKKITSYLQKANDIEDSDKFHDENKEQFIIEEVYDNNTTTDNNKNNSEKVDEIKRLFSEGSSVDEISKIMHLGKGEVLLIKDLYIR